MKRDPSFDERISQYLDNEMTEEQFAEFSQQVAGDPDLRKRLLKLVAMDYAIHQAADHRDRQNTIETVLGQLPQEAEEDSIFELYSTLQSESNKQTAHSMRIREVVSLTGFVAGRALRDPRVIKGLVAATLVLGVLLYIALGGPGETPDTPEVATDHTPQVDEPTESATPVAVATLTAAHKARWQDEGGVLLPSVGDELLSGQRLELTQGQVEITTADGALAVIEAPAIIELIDVNAIGLERGKMVGVCETDSSKGFVIQTPHMDITDLGTRFGVEVQDGQWTEAHVIEGEIEVFRQDGAAAETSQAVRLTGGQAARIKTDKPIERIAGDGQRFASLVPITIELPGTGQGLATNQADANWQIISYEGNDLKVPHIPKVDDNKNYRARFSNDPRTSQWLAWKNTQAIKPADGYNNYLFQTQVTIPASIDPQTARIELSQVADARVTAIMINGQRKPLRKADRDPNGPWHSHEVIDQHLVTGPNTIVFEVQNNRWDAAKKPGPVGLRVQWELHGYGPR